MKRLLATLIVLLSPLFGHSQIELPTVESESDWEKVIITRNVDDIDGLVRVETIVTESKKLFGSQSKLRKKAIDQLKVECAKKGVSIALITLDNFSNSPINNVQIEATLYKHVDKQKLQL